MRLTSMGAIWIVAGALAAAPASAYGLDDPLGARALGMGEALRAAAMGSVATTLNPAGLALARTYEIEASYGFRPEDSASFVNASVCDSVTSRVAACLSYRFLTATPKDDQGEWDEKLHQFGLTLAVPLSQALILGVTNKYVRYSETSPADVSRPDHSRDGALLLDAGLVLKVIPQVNLALVGYNLIGDDDAQFPRAIGAGVAGFLSPKLMISGDGRWNLASSTSRYGAGLEYFLTPAESEQGFPLRIGYVYDTLGSSQYLTAGTGIVTPRIGLDVGARKQVSGGDELMVQLSLRLFLPN